MRLPTALTLALAAIAVMTAPRASGASALSPAVAKKKCMAIKTCKKGGPAGSTCDIVNSMCPVCINFEDSGCYELTNGKCVDWTTDCTKYWNDEDTPGGSGGSGGSGGTGTAGNGGASKNVTATPAPTNATGSNSSADGAGTAGSGAQEEESSDLSLVFAIIGAAMGVIAVAVIFLTLVRRSRAAREEDEEDATTPQALAKDPVSSTAAITYAPLGRGRNASSGASAATLGKDETSAASYYSQQPQALPVVSPRMAGRAVPASATRPQPMPNPIPTARAMPVFSNAAPLGGAQTQTQTQQPVAVAVQEYYQAPGAQPTAAAAAPRRVSSPRNRRESFEF